MQVALHEADRARQQEVQRSAQLEQEVVARGMQLWRLRWMHSDLLMAAHHSAAAARAGAEARPSLLRSWVALEGPPKLE